jgi:hypothetical protein
MQSAAEEDDIRGPRAAGPREVGLRGLCQGGGGGTGIYSTSISQPLNLLGGQFFFSKHENFPPPAPHGNENGRKLLLKLSEN